MENKTFYNEILTEHNLHPYHKHKLEDANLVLEGVNPSCGDDIFLELKVEDGVVVDGAFEGDGCAISQASADMMLELVIGRSKENVMNNIVQVAILYFEFVGVIVIILSGLKGFYNYVRRVPDMKITLAQGLAVGLEFKLCSEILKTVIVRDWKEIVTVAGIIGLRAALTFLIHWEIKEEKNHS